MKVQNLSSLDRLHWPPLSWASVSSDIPFSLDIKHLDWDWSLLLIATGPWESQCEPLSSHFPSVGWAEMGKGGEKVQLSVNTRGSHHCSVITRPLLRLELGRNSTPRPAAFPKVSLCAGGCELQPLPGFRAFLITSDPLMSEFVPDPSGGHGQCSGVASTGVLWWKCRVATDAVLTPSAVRVLALAPLSHR